MPQKSNLCKVIFDKRGVIQDIIGGLGVSLFDSFSVKSVQYNCTKDIVEIGSVNSLERELIDTGRDIKSLSIEIEVTDVQVI